MTHEGPLSRLSKLLEGQWWLTTQLQWYMFTIRIYSNTRDRLRLRYLAMVSDELAERSGTGVQASERAQVDGWPVQLEGESDNSSRSTMVSFLCEPKVYKYYSIISNILMSSFLLKYIFNGPYREISRYLYGLVSGQPAQMAAHCYDFGHFALHWEITDETYGVMLIFSHIAWRTAQRLLRHPYDLGPIWFLLQSKSDIARFIDKLSVQPHPFWPQSSEGPPVATSWALGCLNYNTLSARERFLSKIMCYKVVYGDSELVPGQQRKPTLCKLRPNRTLESRERLAHLLARYTVIGTILLILMTSVIAPYLISAIVFNQYRYLNNYADCFPDLTERHKRGQLARWSLGDQTSGHRIFATLVDLIENLFIWLDTGMAIVHPLYLILLVSHDLQVYWRHLHATADQLRRQTRHLHQMSKINSSNRKNSALENYREAVYHLQAMLSDFGQQIWKADLLVSDVMSNALMVVVSTFAALSFISITIYSNSGNTEFALICLIFCSVASLGYALVNISLIGLERHCRLTHPILCDIMAYDQSRCKGQFTQLLDFYTTKSRFCFTYFHNYPLNSSNFFSVVGWSITSFLILDSVFRRRFAPG